MAASYNASGENGRPPIIPAQSAHLILGIVTTREPALVDRAQVYALPGVSGVGSQSFGWEAAEIRWELTLEAESIAALRLFEAAFREYGAGKRHRLASEGGLWWDFVELARYEPQTLDFVMRPSGAPHVLRTATARWRWCQPG